MSKVVADKRKEVRDTVQDRLERWARWAFRSGTRRAAGTPLEDVMDLHLSQEGKGPGNLYFSNRNKRAIQRGVGGGGPDITATGKQSRATKGYNADDHPDEERTEAAIVYIGETRPELFRAVLAEYLSVCIVVDRIHGKEERREFVKRQTGETEENHRKRKALRLGNSLRLHYQLLGQAYTAIQCYVDLDERYGIQRA